MGGKTGGPLPSNMIKKLEQSAKTKLTDADNNEASRHVFISFAYEDVDEVNLLRGQVSNENTDLQFDDYSVKEAFDSENADYIKRGIREKIDRTSVTVVYLSENSSSSKWVNWEIEESFRRGKGVIGVHKGDAPPTILPSAFSENGCKIVKWTHQALRDAIEEASLNRKTP